ncbi:MAG: hypothetical protein ACE361_10655 [Aureliella sp.]
MAIETRCSGCGKKLAVADEHAGKKARCPACGQIYTVPIVAPVHQSGADEVDPALAETTAGTFSSAGPPAESGLEHFWMQTGDGTEYGPVDRANLNRWYSEGRVGQGYQIRQGVDGPWQSAEIFRPEQPMTQQAAQSTLEAAPSGEHSSSNPYQTQANPYNQTAGQPYVPAANRYPKSDPSGLVLTMGILAWASLLICAPIGWIPGLVAWISGGRGLKDIQAGRADPTNLGLVQVGYYLGMVNVILTLLVVIAFAGIIAIGIISEM